MRNKVVVFIPDEEHWLQFELEPQRWSHANLPKTSYSLSPTGKWFLADMTPLHEESVPKPLRLLALML